MGSITSRLAGGRPEPPKEESSPVLKKNQTVKPNIKKAKLSTTSSRPYSTANQGVQTDAVSIPKRPGPDDLVYERRGSMYIDEYGDMAHEFLDIVLENGVYVVRKVPVEQLTPQGMVKYDVARLRWDYPCVVSDL